MEETANLTDCSTFSQNSVSTSDGTNGFTPRSILFLLKKHDEYLLAKAKPLQKHFSCSLNVVIKDKFETNDLIDIIAETLVVIDDFEGPLFEHLEQRVRSTPKIIQVRGPPAFIDACDKLSLETRKRPLFCNAMTSMVFFCDVKNNKRKKILMVNLIRHMGGSVVHHVGSRVTHIITDHSSTDGYEYGGTFNLPVITTDWVFQCWSQRKDLGFKAGDISVVDYTVKVFSNCYVCFIGFTNDDVHLRRLSENGGTLVALNDIKTKRCTHIVVNDCEKSITHDFLDIDPPIFIVTSAWFWTSIIEGTVAKESEYLFNNGLRSSYSKKCVSSSAPLLEENGLLNNNNCCSQNLFTNSSPNKKTCKLLELVQTEENYVNALSTIMRAQELLDSYSPFLRYYDVSNKILTDCERENPRFHAYLQLCKNECGRQNLKDLLIRPVQRLGSTTLLLKDLLSTTPPSHPDYLKLGEALWNIEKVMNSLNDARKDIADRSVIFDVFNLIENCPSTLISSSRTFVFQFEAQEISKAPETLSRRGDYLVFYIFSDCLEICRKKKEVVATTKEGTFISDKIMKLMHGKPYKHVILMKFSTLRSINNIVCTEDDGKEDLFGFTCREDGELRERHYFFRLIKHKHATNYNKIVALTKLKKTMEQIEGTLTFRPKIVTISAQEVGLNTSHSPRRLTSLSTFACRSKVFMKSIIRNTDNLSPSITQNHRKLSSIPKSLSLDNLLTELQDDQEVTGPLRTASFPIGGR
nr:PREDICTED: protein ECT2-like isoform X2 [Bemisia tabaci]